MTDCIACESSVGIAEPAREVGASAQRRRSPSPSPAASPARKRPRLASPAPEAAAPLVQHSNSGESSDAVAMTPAVALQSDNVLLLVLQFLTPIDLIRAGIVDTRWRASSLLERRLRQRRLFCNSLQCSPELAAEIERAVFALCGGTMGRAYRSKLRQLLSNLRPGKNDELRARVLGEEVTPERLVRMSVNELARSDVRMQREAWGEQSRAAVTRRDCHAGDATVTDMFQCERCGCTRTKYALWRRSPVVDRVRLLVTCLQCKYLWEH